MSGQGTEKVSSVGSLESKEFQKRGMGLVDAPCVDQETTECLQPAGFIGNSKKRNSEGETSKHCLRKRPSQIEFSYSAQAFRAVTAKSYRPPSSSIIPSYRSN